MKRKAIGVLIFCFALLGAIVAGYWDLLNSERLRIARERMENVATAPSGMVQAERPAQDPVAMKGEDPQGTSSAAADGGSDEGEDAEAADAEEAAPPTQEAADAAASANEEIGGALAVDPPARSGIATTIEPVVAANREAAAEPPGQPAPAVPSDTASAEPGAPEDAAASRNGNSADSNPDMTRPTAIPDSPGVDGEAHPGEAGGETAVAGAENADDVSSGAASADTEAIDPSSVIASDSPGSDGAANPNEADSEMAVAGAKSADRATSADPGAVDPSSVAADEEALTPPRFDILRVETDGSTVIAGRAPAQSSVALVSGGRSIATEAASAGGEFVIVLDTPLAPGDYQMRIEASLPDGRRVVSEEIAIVSVPEAGSESELLAMVEAPNAASRLISVPSAFPEAQAEPQAIDVASAESLPAETPDNPAGGEAEDELLLPQTAGEEASAEDAEMVLELPERVSTFFSRARALSVDAGGLGDGEAPPATVAIAQDAASVAEEGRALAEDLPLAATTREGGSDARLVELVRETAETAGEVGATAAAVDLARTTEAADRLAELADEAETRLSSLGDDRVEPSGPVDADASAASVETGGAVGALAVEAVEIENDMIYIAGRAEPGSTVRIYLDNEYLADDKVAVGDRFLIATNAGVARGDHLVRADQINANGRVTARVEVPFFKPEGAMMSAIAPALPPPERSGGVEMLPAVESDPEPAAGDEDQRADAAAGKPASDTAGAGVASTGSAAADTAAGRLAVAEAAMPDPEKAGRTADAGQGSSPLASNNSSNEAELADEAAPSAPDEARSVLPGPNAGADSAGGPPDRSDPSAPPSRVDPGDTDVAAVSEERSGPDDLPSGGAASPPDGAAAVEVSPAGASRSPAGPAGAGDDFSTAAITADEEVPGPAAGSGAEKAVVQGTGSAGTRPADRPTSLAPNVAKGAEAPTDTEPRASASDIDSAVDVGALPPAEGRPAAPVDEASSATADGSGTAGPGEDTGIAVSRQPALKPADSRVIIRKGDTLWAISRETYGRGSRYTVIYLANGDQIRDPDRIYPGQVFRLPDDLMDALDSAGRAN